MRGFTEIPLLGGSALWLCDWCRLLTVDPPGHLRWHREQTAQLIEQARICALPAGGGE